jgi:hypothetical protein
MSRIKLYWEFLREKEEDPLASLGLGDDKEKEKEKEKKEDPFKKEEEAKKKEKERIEKKHQEFVEDKLDDLESILQRYPELDREVGEMVVDAVKSQDRVKIHNVFNRLMKLQVKFQEQGKEDSVERLAKLKDVIEELDKSYTEDRLM